MMNPRVKIQGKQRVQTTLGTKTASLPLSVRETLSNSRYLQIYPHPCELFVEQATVCPIALH